MRPPLLLSANQFSDTFAATPLPNVPFPLAIERERQHDATSNHLARIEECARRLSPWQRVLNWKTSDAGIEVMFERFVGLTFDAWTASLRKHQRCLPLDVWLVFAEDLLTAFMPAEDQFLGAPLGRHSLGWTLTGELRQAPTTLNALLDRTVVLERRQRGRQGDPTQHLSLEFVSLEFLLGRPHLPQSTVFVVGGLLVQMLTGVHPFFGETKAETLHAMRDDRPFLPKVFHGDVSPALEHVLLRALAPDPQHRWPHVYALRDAISATVGVRPVAREVAMGALAGIAWPEVEALMASLWDHDECLPARWNTVWPDGVHPLEGLAVLEDRLLEHRLPIDLFSRWNIDFIPSREPDDDGDAATGTPLARLIRRYFRE